MAPADRIDRAKLVQQFLGKDLTLNGESTG